MDVSTSAVLTGIVATVGNYVKNKKWPNVKFIVGGGMYLLFLTAIDSAQPDIAKQLATLVLVTTVLIYMASITKALGYSK